VIYASTYLQWQLVQLVTPQVDFLDGRLREHPNAIHIRQRIVIQIEYPQIAQQFDLRLLTDDAKGALELRGSLRQFQRVQFSSLFLQDLIYLPLVLLNEHPVSTLR
jgi:hypothetical protein